MLMKHRGHKVRGTEQCKMLWWTIKHIVITLLLVPCQQPHAHSPRLTPPFTHSVSIHKQSSIYLHVSVIPKIKYKREKAGHGSADIAQGMMDLLTMGFIVQCFWIAPGGKYLQWMSFIHTQFTFRSFQLETGVGPSHVVMKKYTFGLCRLANRLPPPHLAPWSSHLQTVSET